MRPILFTALMVNAILAGRKTQTRRLIKFPPWALKDGEPLPTVLHNLQHVGGVAYYEDGQPRKRLCLRYRVGDRLWVREAWASNKPCSGAAIYYRADADNLPDGLKWRPSIFMPRWASRIALQVTAVRVERLQHMSEKDAEAEGLHDTTAFSLLWDSINGKRALWKDNPWVCVVAFKRVQP